MSDPKKPCFHLDDCWTYGMTALSHRIRERQQMQSNADEREILYPNRAGREKQSWGRQVVMQDIVERLEAEGATVIRKKGVIVAVFDEDG